MPWIWLYIVEEEKGKSIQVTWNGSDFEGPNNELNIFLFLLFLLSLLIHLVSLFKKI